MICALLAARFEMARKAVKPFILCCQTGLAPAPASPRNGRGTLLSTGGGGHLYQRTEYAAL